MALAVLLGSLKQASPFSVPGLCDCFRNDPFRVRHICRYLGFDRVSVSESRLSRRNFLYSALAARRLCHLGGRWFSAKVRYSLFSKRKAQQSLRAKQESLRNLTPDEKAYLVPYIRDQSNTQYFQLEDGISNGLVAKQILYRAANIGSLMTGWAFNLQPWVREYLAANPDVLDGASESPSGPPQW